MIYLLIQVWLNHFSGMEAKMNIDVDELGFLQGLSLAGFVTNFDFSDFFIESQVDDCRCIDEPFEPYE